MFGQNDDKHTGRQTDRHPLIYTVLRFHKSDLIGDLDYLISFEIIFTKVI